MGIAIDANRAGLQRLRDSGQGEHLHPWLQIALAYEARSCACSWIEANSCKSVPVVPAAPGCTEAEKSNLRGEAVQRADGACLPGKVLALAGVEYLCRDLLAAERAKEPETATHVEFPQQRGAAVVRGCVSAVVLFARDTSARPWEMANRLAAFALAGPRAAAAGLCFKCLS